MPEHNIDGAFRLLDQDLRAAPGVRPTATGSSLRTAARRRHRTAAAGSVLAVTAVVAGVSVTAAALPLGSAGGDTTTTAPAAAPLPATTPCADPAAWDLPSTQPDSVLPMSMATGALTNLQLTATDLGEGWATAKVGRLTSMMPGTWARSAYVDADGRALTTPQLTGAPSWQLSQSITKVQDGTGAAVWQAALDRSLCTTAVHQVQVLATGQRAGVEWLALRDTRPTMVSDGNSDLVPGEPSVFWIVLARAGDTTTKVRVNTWGDSDYMTSEPPARWLEQLSDATAARLAGEVPEPVPPLVAATRTHKSGVSASTAEVH